MDCLFTLYCMLGLTAAFVGGVRVIACARSQPVFRARHTSSKATGFRQASGFPAAGAFFRTFRFEEDRVGFFGNGTVFTANRDFSMLEAARLLAIVDRDVSLLKATVGCSHPVEFAASLPRFEHNRIPDARLLR